MSDSTHHWRSPPESGKGAAGLALTATAIGVVCVFVVVWLVLNKPALIVPLAVFVLLVAGVRWWRVRRRAYVAYADAQDHEVRDEWDGERQPSSRD